MEVVKPTKKEFKDKLFSLNPHGDPEGCYQMLLIKLEEEVVTWEGQPVTFQVIIDTYKEYREWWKDEYGKRDKQYIGEDQKLKNIRDFIYLDLFNRSFVSSPTNRVLYLMGNNDKKQMEESLNAFKKETHIRRGQNTT